MQDHVTAYYSANRQLGHTTALLKAAQELNALFLCATERHAHDLRKTVPKEYAKNIIANPELLVGQYKALIIDNFAIVRMLTERNSVIEALQKEVTSLRMKLGQIARISQLTTTCVVHQPTY